MKKILIFSFFCINIFCAKSQNLPHFEAKYSSTLSILRYLEAAAQVSHYSPTYRKLIIEKVGLENAEFNKILADFQSINLDCNYKWDDYPDSRHSQRSTYDLVNIAAVNANDLNDFASRIIGIFPNDDFIRFINCLEKIKPFHDALFVNYDSKIKKQVKQYAPYQERLGNIFSQVSNFYGTKWATSIPFQVCLYPIPIRAGTSSATPHGNTLICAFLADREDDYKERMAVVTHEMCHILYDGQSADNQHYIEKIMNKSKSKYKSLAYQYFDEGMATAIGNGWAYEVLNNKIDQTDWYNDDIINAYGHTLFPLVKSYLRTGKTIDSTFINEAIELFATTAPNSVNDYNVMLNDVFISGSFPDSLTAPMMKIIAENFRISSRTLSTPFVDDETKKDFLKTKAAKVLLFSEDLKTNWEYLKKIDPVVAEKFAAVDGTPDVGQYFSFVSEQGSSYLIVFYSDLNMLKAIFQQVKKERFIEPEQPLHELK
jgi:hypothetical protein